MGIQHEDTQPTVDLVKKATELEENKHVVDSLLSTNKSGKLMTNLLHEEMAKDPVKKGKKRRRRDSAKSDTNPTLPTLSCSKNEELTEINISQTDLDELRTVYNKCKAIVKKIELKYGHLLESSDNSIADTPLTTEGNDEKCNCKLGKKTIFDESGLQTTVEPNAARHICPQKPVKTGGSENIQQKNIQIEYSQPNDALPDDLKDLAKILHNCELDKSYRYMVISKIQFLRQQYTEEIKNNKKTLIEQLKSNPYDILGFEGTNLSTIMGYK